MSATGHTFTDLCAIQPNFGGQLGINGAGVGSLARPCALVGKEGIVHGPIAGFALFGRATRRFGRASRLGVDVIQWEILKFVAHPPCLNHLGHERGHGFGDMAVAEGALVIGKLDNGDGRICLPQGGHCAGR